jgi:ketosteroid isomerase-like protein
MRALDGSQQACEYRHASVVQGKTEMRRRLARMRTLVIGAALAMLVALSACGGSSSSSASEDTLQHEADLYSISQIEKTFHEAITKKDIDQMMSLYAPNATATFGPGQTVSGTEQIRDVWLNSVAFGAETNWLSDHPAYKLKVTVDGDRGTLRFECHFVDLETGKVEAVTAGSSDVARVDDVWLITNFVGSTAELKI